MIVFFNINHCDISLLAKFIKYNLKQKFALSDNTLAFVIKFKRLEVKMTENKTGEIIIYQADDGQTKIDVRFEEETLWLTQQQMAELFHSSRTNVVEHIRHIYAEGELDESSTCRKFRQVQKEGVRNINRELPFYNLDMIISLGYRVKSIWSPSHTHRHSRGCVIR